MKGHQIHNLSQLKQAANERRSVVVPSVKVWKPWPAAVMINQQGWVLLNLFNKGMFIYEKCGPVVDAEFKPKESEAHNGNRQ